MQTLNKQVSFIDIDKYLAEVSKPQRYINTELNLVKKDWESAKVRLCLAFPDVYEIGMSYFGFQILYEIVNKERDFLAERTYAPWIDLEGIMRREKVPLFSWESRHPLRSFDVIGFTLPHELNYTNVLNMLDLAGLPVEAEERIAALPIVIGGGECALSPEPLSLFFDAFVLGDGEKIILDILKIIAEFKEKEDLTKRELLAQLQSLAGIYVPSFYEFDYEDGRIKKFSAKTDAPESAKECQKFLRQIVSLKESTQVEKPVVPLMNIVQDRAVVEVRRGCTVGCRFCRAGMINRPVRERPPEQILDLAEKALSTTGYEELSLLSLNTIDYTELRFLIDDLNNLFAEKCVSIDLPSLRVKGFDVEIAERIARVRKSGLTFAPEVGTERLSYVINKPLSRNEFLREVDEVLRRGWRTIKLYFMIGLPTENYADLDGIIDIVKTIERKGKTAFSKKFKLNVTISPFVPKPHTPFQWTGQMNRSELQRRLEYIVKRVKSRNVFVKGGDIEQGFLEAILSRGDRRLGAVIKEAWQKGAKFDNWSECFNLQHWLFALEKAGLDPEEYANRQPGLNEILPWEHIVCGVKRDFLEEEWQRAHQGEVSADCAVDDKCTACGVCSADINNELAKRVLPIPVCKKSEDKLASLKFTPKFRLRLFYTKKGRMRFLAHRDLAKVLLLLFRQIKLPLAYTSGFNPRARIQFAPPLPLGFEGREEIVDTFLVNPVDFPSVREDLNQVAPAGIEFLRLQQVPLHCPSIEAASISAEYSALLPREKFRITTGERRINGLIHIDIEEIEERFSILLKISLKPGEYTNPLEILSQLAGREIKLVDVDYIGRLKIFLFDNAS